MTYPIRVQRAPDEGLVYLHFGDATHHPMQTRSFALLEDDHFQARDFYEGTELAKLLGTSSTSIPGVGVKVRLPEDRTQVPPGYQLRSDGIIDPYYVIRDNDLGEIVTGTHATRGGAVADAWDDYDNRKGSLT